MLCRFLPLALFGAQSVAPVPAPAPETLQERVIGRLTEEIGTKYAFKGAEGWLVDSLTRNQEQGSYASLDRGALGGAITSHLRGWTSDKHFMVAHMPVFAAELEAYVKEPKNVEPPKDDPAEVAANYGIQKRDMLDDNIGMIKLNNIAFSPGTVSAFQEALLDLSDANALILDLRDNHGGSADTAIGLLSCFFPKGESVTLGTRYWRPTDETTVLATEPSMSGARYYDHPTFVLTNKDTRSAAEALAYHLRAFGRVTVVGEKSSGGAHPADMVSLGDGFVALIPMGIVTSAKTGTDWEGRGVPIDVPCSSAHALDRAYELVREALDSVR